MENSNKKKQLKCTVLGLSVATLTLGGIGVVMIMLDGLIWGLIASLICVATAIICLIGSRK